MGRPKCCSEPRVTTAIRLPASLHEALHEAAAARDVSANLLLTRALSDFLDRLPPPDLLLETRGVEHGASDERARRTA
ncbi:MAG: hypothetical protein ACLQK4_13275 [Acidimicrobiales bacterium]